MAPPPPLPPESPTRRRQRRVRLIATSLAASAALGLAPACGRSEDPPPRPAPERQKGESATAAGSPAGSPAAPAAADPGALSARADRARIQGSASASVWVVEVSDFQCPFCKMWHDSTYAALRREYVETGKVRMAYLNLPLPSHRNAWPAAEAAMCAAAQDRFWQMHDALFDTQERWGARADAEAYFADSLAGRAGVDPAALRSCMTSDRLRPLIQADFDRAVASGVESTPTFIIGDGAMVRGAAPLENFRQVIDSVLAQKAGRPQQR